MNSDYPNALQASPNSADLRQSLPKTGIHLAYELGAFDVTEHKPDRALKGSVSVCEFKGWLRLRWSYNGKRHTLSMGLPDSKINRVVAERKAKLIERDILTEQFDSTLARYKPQALTSDGISVLNLFERFTQYKAKQVDPRTIDKYLGLQGYLRQFFKNREALSITEDDAFKFRDWLKPQIQLVTISERLGLLRSCWKWGIRKGWVKENPWMDVKVKVPPKQRPRPFSKDESMRILEGFRSDPTYSYYSDFVEFLLATGCRIGEASGLKWGHLSDDCTVIWIGESWTRGVQKATKTNRPRAFSLSPRLQAMLLNRRPESFEPNRFVFQAPQGGSIDDHNFRNRAWKPILKQVGVEYRMPRNSRHTFVSHAIDQGLTPAEVSEITGHSPKTLMQNYLGTVRGQVQLPELWD